MLEFKTDYETLDDLIYRLNKRAEIREQITTRKSVQEQKPDRISELLKEAARTIWELGNKISEQLVQVLWLECEIKNRDSRIEYLKKRLDDSCVGYVK